MGEPERAGEGTGREEPEFCVGQVELGMQAGHSGGVEMPGGATLGLETQLRHQGSQACRPEPPGEQAQARALRGRH